MLAEVVVIALLVMLFGQQMYYLRQIQVLVDKLMSRTYNEYVQATAPPPVRTRPAVEIPEDLRPLQEFQI